jgi:hypothetical protein
MKIITQVKMEQEVRKTAMLERKIKEQEKDIANHVRPHTPPAFLQSLALPTF